jgi:flagellar motor component MotA
LADEEPDIYMETLGMLRAVVGALVPHMSTLDVHLMLGSFIGVIVANTVSGNIRT